ncbi:MAG TPA: hypothetical protein VHE99_00260 [Gammaproteobacteria bacterium]|nr:hypothetical protein [Gammaproteobacteria bacterium]
MNRKTHPSKEIEAAIQYAEKMDGAIKQQVIQLTHGEDYYAP